MARVSARWHSTRSAALLIGAASLCGSGSAAAQEECRGFLEEPVIDEGTSGVEALAIEDLDGDGDLDLLSASFGDGKVFWYENDGLTPPGFSARRIADGLSSASAVHAADLDGDGDADVLAASRAGSRLFWYENDGQTPPGFLERSLSASPRLPLDVFAADLDGDGDTDVLSASFDDDTIFWYENDGNVPPVFTARAVSTTADAAASVFAADLDGDGDADVLSASRLDDTVAWYENDGAADPAFTERAITTAADGADSVFAADLDGDGDADVLAASLDDDTVAWHENRGGAPPVFVAHPITTLADEATAVVAVDLDGDGRRDVLAASRLDDTIAWFRNDGATPPGFARFVVSTAAASAQDVVAGDLDGDGDLDVVSASSRPGFPATDDKIAWYENDGAPADGLLERRIYRSADGAVAVDATDLDGDGDTDVAAIVRPDRLAWYENVGTVVPVFEERVLSTGVVGPTAVLAADLDGDGDADLLTAAATDDTIAWHENDGAVDPAFLAREITAAADDVRALAVADVDGDGDLDVLGASAGDDTLAWFESDGAAPPAFAERIVATDVDGAAAVGAADVDGDGALDLLSASAGDSKLTWWESDGAVPPAFTRHDLTSSARGASSISGADIDGDGDVDILASWSVDDTIAWYQNDGAEAPAFNARSVAVTARGVTFAAVSDVDGDGVLDVVAATPADDGLAWYRNDGADPPVFTTHRITSDADGARSVAVADVDGDGDKDLLAGRRLAISWYRSFGEICDTFDASGDGMTDGVELAWIGRAFGLASAAPEGEWWFGVDYNRDGRVDGEDLSILGAPGVFGLAVADCSFICP